MTRKILCLYKLHVRCTESYMLEVSPKNLEMKKIDGCVRRKLKNGIITTFLMGEFCKKATIFSAFRTIRMMFTYTPMRSVKEIKKRKIMESGLASLPAHTKESYRTECWQGPSQQVLDERAS